MTANELMMRYCVLAATVEVVVAVGLYDDHKCC